MKTKLFLLALLIPLSANLLAQSWQTGTNKLYSYPTSTTNVGIGTSNPLFKLDVNGKLYLRTTEVNNGWNSSHIYWAYHSLVMGTPPGTYSHNTVELKPGGTDNQSEILYSKLELYNTTGIGQHEKTIDLHSRSWCWFNTGGNFGINTSAPQYQLDVRGTIFGTGLIVDGIIKTKEIIVTPTPTADFVFDKCYNLRPLQEVESFVQENKHLPEIPSATEMEQNGVNLNEFTIQLLQKVEELTLYTIEQEKRIKQLEEQLNK